MYALYDFGSAWDQYLEEHLTGWSYWAIASFAWSVVHMGYITFLLVYTIVEFSQPEPFEGTIYQAPYLWITIAVNSLALILPLSKLIIVHIENGEEEDGLFKLKSEVGQYNYEMEVWADIAKCVVLALDYAAYVFAPNIAEHIAPNKFPIAGILAPEWTAQDPKDDLR